MADKKPRILTPEEQYQDIINQLGNGGSQYVIKNTPLLDGAARAAFHSRIESEMAHKLVESFQNDPSAFTGKTGAFKAYGMEVDAAHTRQLPKLEEHFTKDQNTR